MENAHTKSATEVLDNFGVNENTGLTLDQVRTNLDKYGPNGEYFITPVCPTSFHPVTLCGSIHFPGNPTVAVIFRAFLLIVGLKSCRSLWRTVRGNGTGTFTDAHACTGIIRCIKLAKRGETRL
uniref:Cation-transporting P-type ATPase N-terminal domain-containing protein n=1 Tax=Sphaeramia orbicularis TaxID=375764 RepID=A0A673BMY7_9TELE